MMLGNLSIDQMEKRLGKVLPEPFRSEFAMKRQEEANNIKLGKWHCFDIPFMLVAGDVETAQEIVSELQKAEGTFRASMQIATQKGTK